MENGMLSAPPFFYNRVYGIYPACILNKTT